MERLKKLHTKYADQGLEVIGVTLAYGHGYDPDKDEVDVNGDRAPADERADLGLFAKKYEIVYRLAVIDRATTEEYGVASLPHTVLLDNLSCGLPMSALDTLRCLTTSSPDAAWARDLAWVSHTVSWVCRMKPATTSQASLMMQREPSLPNRRSSCKAHWM